MVKMDVRSKRPSCSFLNSHAALVARNAGGVKNGSPKARMTEADSCCSATRFSQARKGFIFSTMSATPATSTDIASVDEITEVVDTPARVTPSSGISYPPGHKVESKSNMEQGLSTLPEVELDIEHLVVVDDPRLWPRRRKMAILWWVLHCLFPSIFLG